VKHVHDFEPAVIIRTAWGRNVWVRQRVTNAAEPTPGAWLCSCGERGVVCR
jgi:hypothetical protein